MADRKISELTNITGSNVADADEFVVVDTSADETKAITASELRTAIGNGDFTVTGDLTVQGTTITVDSATAQTIDLGDNDKMQFGDGNDLQIYHDGNNSYIQDTGTGDLKIYANDFNVWTSTGSARYLDATSGGAVNLYYNGAAKLATTSTGVDITGTLTSDGLTVDAATSTFQNSSGSADVVLDRSANSFGATLQYKTGGSLKWYHGLRGLINDNFYIFNNTASGNSFSIDTNNDISFYEDTGTTAKFFWDASAEVLEVNKLSALGDQNTKLDLTIANTARIFTGGLERLRIDGSGNVGINTSSPYSFGVNAKTLTLNGVKGGAVAFTRGTNSATKQWALRTSDDDALRFEYGSTLASEAMRIDSSGNVGIGTSSPAAKLEVYGADDTNNLIVGHNNTDFAVYTDSTVGEVRLKAEDGSGSNFSKFMTFYTQPSGSAAAERLRITSSGLTGIGTSSPQAKLDVTGDVAGEHGIFVYNSNASGYSGLRMGGSDRGTNGDHLVYGSGALGLRSKTGASITFEPSGSEAMRIDSSGFTTIRNNMQIGEADTVNQYQGVSLLNAKDSSAATTTSYIDTKNNLGISDSHVFFDHNTDGSSTIIFGTTVAGSRSSDRRSEAMRIDSSGNLLVGRTTTPPTAGAKIAVAGASDTAVQITKDGVVAGRVMAVTTGLAFGVDGSDGATERMRIDSSGNVGIGTSSPDLVGSTTSLTLDSSGGNGQLSLMGNGTVYGRIFADNATGDLKMGNPTSNDVMFYTANVERMRIDASGNFMVGRTSSQNGNSAVSFEVNDDAVNNVWAHQADTTTGTGSGIYVATTTINSSLDASGYFYDAASDWPNSFSRKFAVRKDGVIFSTNTSISSLSDRRIKENIVDATDGTDGLDVINGLRVRRFDYKSGYGRDLTNQVGFIAQEVETVLPSIVDRMHDMEYNDDGESLRTLQEGKLVPILVKAIQEQQATITALEARITALENG